MNAYQRIGTSGLLTTALCLAAAAPAARAVQIQRPSGAPEKGLRTVPSQPTTPAQPALTEPEVLDRIARYLKLTRRQAGLLYSSARSVARTGIPAAERETRLALEELAKHPDVEPETQSALQARHGALRAEKDRLMRSAADVLSQVFTREQIALTWRLCSGNPPESSHIDPRLLDPRSQLPTRRRFRLLTEEVLSFGDGTVPVEFTARLNRATSGEALREATRLQEFGDRVDTDLSGRRKPARPFPQRVVEAADPREFVPELSPLAERLYSSAEFPSFLRLWLSRGPGEPRRTIGAVRGQPMLRQYHLNLGPRDRRGIGSPLASLGGEWRPGGYLFGPGQGLELSNAGVTDHYGLDLTFSFGAWEEYQKLLDLKDRKRDGGLYLHQGAVTFYGLAAGGSPTPGRLMRLRLERDRDTRIVQCYLDGRRAFAFIDLDGEAVFDQKRATLFADDAETQGKESGSGAALSLVIWGPKSADPEIKGPSNPPGEGSSGPLP